MKPAAIEPSVLARPEYQSQLPRSAPTDPVAPQCRHKQDRAGPRARWFQLIERKGSQRVYHHQDGRFVVVHYHRAKDTLPPYVIRNLLASTRWSEADPRRLKLVR